jgi:hypothetical protein
MKLNITFQEVNSEYSQEYADEYQFGKESLDNEKYNSGEAFELTEEIDDIKIIKNQIADYTDKSNKLEDLSLVFEKLTLIQCIKNDKVIAQYGVSDELLKKTHKIYKEKSDTFYYYFTLKDNMHYQYYDSHIYVLIKDIKRIV